MHECLHSRTTSDPWPLRWLPQEGLVGSGVISVLCESGRKQCCCDVYPGMCSLEETAEVQFLQQGCGRVGVDVILCVIFIVVKCKCCYLLFPFCSGFIWLIRIFQCMWYLMNMIEILFPNFYKLPNVYLQVCWMIYF